MVSNIGKYILRELAILRAIGHPNIVQFLGLCKHETEVFVVTEFVSKGDLMEVIHDTSYAELTWSLRTHLMLEIAKPLAYLHKRNIVHRDVKLENVLVDDAWNVKLCDFGFARCMVNEESNYRDRRTRKMTVAGTDQWMAPEVLMQQPYNECADMFSLGCTFYEIMCRRQPPSRNVASKYAFDVQDFLSHVPKNTPKQLIVLVLDLCQMHPSKRPSASQVVDLLLQVQKDLPPVNTKEMSSKPTSMIKDDAEEEKLSSSSRSNNKSSEQARSSETDEDTLTDVSKSRIAEPRTNSQLKRMLSAGDIDYSSSSPQRSVVYSEQVRRFPVRFKNVTKVVLEGWSHISDSSDRLDLKKRYCALTNDGTIFVWKSDKKSEMSIQRIVCDRTTQISKTNDSCISIKSPVHGTMEYMLDFKSGKMAYSWFVCLTRIIESTELDFSARLASGERMGFSSASRDKRGKTLKTCFPVRLKNAEAPVEECLLVVDHSVIRAIIPITEEVMYDWDFSSIAAYSLEPDAHVTISVTKEENKRFGKHKSPAVFKFYCPENVNDVYESLEESWRRKKEMNDQLFSEAMKLHQTNKASASAASSPGGEKKTPILGRKKGSFVGGDSRRRSFSLFRGFSANNILEPKERRESAGEISSVESNSPSRSRAKTEEASKLTKTRERGESLNKKKLSDSDGSPKK